MRILMIIKYSGFKLFSIMTCDRRAFLHLLPWLLVLANSFHTDSISANAGDVLCLKKERQALLRFKQDLIIPSNCLSSWDASHADCCNWPEVVCDNLTGHVKELHLHNPYDFYCESEFESERRTCESSMLQGKINPSLLDMKYLHYLDLSYNDFGGVPIPSYFGSLVSLTYLNLSKAGFEGLIPHQLGNLSNLHYLGIRGIYMDDETKYAFKYSLYVDNLHWLSGLSSLEHLDLQRVNLSAASHEWLGIINSFPSFLELHLSSCGLAFIPFLSTVNFTSLSVLDISSNYFNATIPKWILSLSKLKSLDLRGNAFIGAIPNSLSNLTSLATLNLAGNSLTSPLPDWLFGLNGLISLSLSDNHFCGSFPTGFQNLTSLRELDLSYVDFSNSSIPEWVFKLQHLESLRLSSGNLSGKISSAMQNMSSLIELDLSYNGLEGPIPKTMRSLCNLQEIALFGNKFGGELSKAIESISGCSSRNLQLMGFGYNKFSGSIPCSLQRFPSLTTLCLQSNQLVGNIPQCLGFLSNLEVLHLSSNMLEGIVTEVHFKNLTHLIYFFANDNNLTLKVSPNWAPPFRLKDLSLRRWNLGPQFPLWLQYQNGLTYLDLSNTGIFYSIPSWFWNITFLVSHYISLSSNQLSGPLPRISANIYELDLSNNSFSGSISVLLCNLVAQVNNKLSALHLGENLLSGEIPDCWMNWQSLTFINMANNYLTGKIPSSIAKLGLLESLHLRNNNLVGDIPAFLQNCTELQVLDLGLNNFAGKMPEWLGFFQNLKVLVLPSNKLEGEIPLKFCHLISLQILDLSKNNLSGSIPTCINNLTAMTTLQSLKTRIYYSLRYFLFESAFVVIKGREVQYDRILALAVCMDMSGNKLSGGIPKEITALLGLHSLNLSGNNLTGKIPTNFGDMQQLESVDLSWNQIFGRIPPSMSSMHFLSYLNVSYNNLSGEIPLSTQLQSLTSSSFVGNKLCGPPLTESCSAPAIPPQAASGSEHKGEGTKVNEFYLGMVVGFLVGFWGIFGPLLYSSSWRICYFRFLSKVWCRFYGFFGN